MLPEDDECGYLRHLFACQRRHQPVTALYASANQPISQSANQPISQSANQPIMMPLIIGRQVDKWVTVAAGRHAATLYIPKMRSGMTPSGLSSGIAWQQRQALQSFLP
ncbi:hypothetical protein EHW65_10815 [Erwinia psidii]|nr:hypothetical protein [Erwinia psidii]